MAMPNFKIPFSGVGAKYTENERAAVLEAMEVTSTLTQGKYQETFQTNFAKDVGRKHAFATNCAATALELAAILLELKPGDEVICPAHTYCASAYPFAKHGAKLVWADIDADTLVIDVNTIKPLITEKTKAIICVHLYGLPAPMNDICNFVKDKDIVVIEDCAQAIGATIDGKKVGGFGDMSIFSFHTHKNISTLGEGGMLCLDNDKWAKYVPGLRHNGHAPYPSTREFYWEPAMSNVDFDIAGVWPNNFCIGEVQCALGIEMLSRVDTLNIERKKRFDRFVEVFSEFPELKFQKIPDGFGSAHHLLPFTYKNEARKKERTNINPSYEFIRTMAYEHGVQAIVQYYPLNRYPLFTKAGFDKADVPNTDDFFDNMVSLPFHHWLPEDDFEFMIEATKKTLAKLA